MREIFTSLLGNTYLRETLATDLAAGRAAHGYILSGPVGSGKKTAARLMAAASVCTHRMEESFPLPCGKCESCHRILHDLSADVLWITREEDKASIGVEQVRTVREDLYVTPNDGERKFYIIEEAHTMTAQAQNALLLSLEEPPAFVTFLLLTEDPMALLETIRSRAPVIHMELFSPAVVRDWLADQPGVPKDTERLEGAAVLSGGALGQALVLATGSGDDHALQMRALSLQLLEGIFRRRPSVLLEESLAVLPKEREKMCLVLTMLQAALRDLITRKRQAAVAGQFLLGTESVCSDAGRFSMSRLLSLYDLCGTALARLDANGSIAPCMTSFLLQAKRICH